MLNTAVTPLLTHWSYQSLALSHWHIVEYQALFLSHRSPPTLLARGLGFLWGSDQVAKDTCHITSHVVVRAVQGSEAEGGHILQLRGRHKWGLVHQFIHTLQTQTQVQHFNSLGPSDAIWRWGSWSTLVQVMACCLTAQSHYLNQCWLIISKGLWHSSEDIIIRRFEVTYQ